MPDYATEHPLKRQDLAKRTLVATSISHVVVILDTSVVNVALKDISAGLDVDMASLHWVVNSYFIVFASFLMSGGALGDVLGARRTYLIGLAVFTVTSLMCGLASSIPVLIVGRALQGIGAAFIVPCALSLITRVNQDDASRARAIALWSSWGAAALVLGPLVGGLLLAAFDWRSIFIINVPIGVLGLWLALRVEDGFDDHRRRRKFDLPGQTTAAITCIGFVMAISEASSGGLGSRWLLLWIAMSFAAGVSFILIERNRRAPMLPLSLFSSFSFSCLCVTVLDWGAVFLGTLFALNLYFLQAIGLTPLQTGFALLPLALMVAVGNFASAGLVRKLSSWGLIVLGAAIRFAGCAGLTVVTPEIPYPITAIFLMLIGLGTGIGAPIASALLLSMVEKPYAGAISGLSRAIGQLGGAIGVAGVGGLLAQAGNISDGFRLSAAISMMMTGALVPALWYLWRFKQTRARR
ncbi:DHA2 family methylenomycin A resistance protein-like MFS transporter [Bradyrhizobium sp. USDA 3311]